MPASYLARTLTSARSSLIVALCSMNSETLESTLNEATARLTNEFAPEQVWLFGSHAWGEPNADSDLDFFIVVPERTESYSTRMDLACDCLDGLPVPADILLATRKEFERFRDVKASLSYKIGQEGRLLYGRP